MRAPSKPWDNTNLRNTLHQQNISGVNLGSGRNVLYSHGPQPSGYAGMTNPVTNSQRVSTLPPLPQRPQQLFNRSPTPGMAGLLGYPGYSTGYGSYGGYGGSSYSGYGASSYGGFGGMYGLGGYGSGGYGTGGYGSFGSFPVGGGVENRFLQVAEESSRDAFQSIESIVRAFASVSMMLESTYYAMYASFRAILGVVDNFSRLRQMFVQFLSTVTILRIIRNFYRQLLHWLGVLDHSPQPERVWESVGGQAGDDRAQQMATSPKWPLITFMAFLFGGPYLISKFFSSSKPGGKEWDYSEGTYVRTAYPHQAGTQAELSFQANEVLNLAPRKLQTCESSGWLLAGNQNDQFGFVPVTRLGDTITAPSASTATNSTASTATTPLVSTATTSPASIPTNPPASTPTTPPTSTTKTTPHAHETSNSQSNQTQGTECE